MKRILLCCAAGMSTSLLVQKMKQAADKRGLEAEIWAESIDQLQKNVDEGIDVVLLGPQIRYKANSVKEICSTKDIPSDIINTVDYGTMNGEKVLDYALNLMK